MRLPSRMIWIFEREKKAFAKKFLSNHLSNLLHTLISRIFSNCYSKLVNKKILCKFFCQIIMGSTLNNNVPKGCSVLSIGNLDQFLTPPNCRRTLCCKFLGSFAFFDVKCLCSGGQEWGRGEATPTSISIFDFYGTKTLCFEFGNDIFSGNKMPTL